MKNWYLVYTKPHKEQVAKENLERQGYETYLPMTLVRRRRMGRGMDSVEPLFPRYLFIHLDATTDNWSPIRSTLGVNSLVKFGMYPSTVPDSLIEVLRTRDNDQGIQDIGEAEMKTGQTIRVMEGAMAGLEGIYLAKTGAERAMVLLDIVGKQTKVSIGSNQIGSID
jgi:transcriptional antiterminator RfaH